MSRIQGVRKYIIAKGVCKRCAGNGQLWRPLKDENGDVVKLINFVRCTDCGGNGVRFKALNTHKKL